MESIKSNMSKSAKYLKAFREGGNNEAWNLLNKAQKKYAEHLVSKWAYDTELAIQCAYIWGYDKHPYDHRAQEVVEETMPMEAFGF